MKKIGIMSCNIYCNFTNYGSALQSWALKEAINSISEGTIQGVLVDYCPEVLLNRNFLNPLQYMWDTDPISRKMCELSLPAIRINYYKFDEFYHKKFQRTNNKYTKDNFNDIIHDTDLDGFVCGSDTIFCVDEFGFDDGYYANFSCMKNQSISYAASFGDTHFDENTYKTLNQRLQNFKAISIRENGMLSYIKEHVDVPAEKVIDPTLLLEEKDYICIEAPRQEESKYILLYARRYNPQMEEFAETKAKENGWKIIEISLRATNAERHRVFYEAGVEEFLSLIKHAEMVITNSFHGLIFSVQYRKEFFGFSREQCDTKIIELLNLFGLSDRLLTSGKEAMVKEIDYVDVHKRISIARAASKDFLKKAMLLINKVEKL
ncbi:polysaccharide pyruvyl transferase family protein [Amedibacillus sp. YH-ame10]